MIITAISDTHRRHHLIDQSYFLDTDVLIHAGDFSSGSLNSTIEFLDWLEELLIPNKILVAGNHDWVTTRPEFKQLLKDHAPSVYYLENASVTIDGVKFYGSPYSNQFCDWAWMEEEFDLEAIWAKIPQDTNVVITHGPAYGYNDKVDNDFQPGRDKHVGSPSLRKKLASMPDLKLHISGHIHCGYGITQGQYLSIGASTCNEDYNPVNPPISIHLKD